MDCGDCRKLIPGLDLGVLGATEQAEVRGHLAGCTSCDAEAVAHQRVWGQLDLLDVSEVEGIDLWDRIRCEVGSAPAGKSSFLRLVRTWPVAAAAALLVGLVYFLSADPVDSQMRRTGGLAPEDAEVVANLDLLENLELLQVLEAAEDPEMAELFAEILANEEF